MKIKNPHYAFLGSKDVVDCEVWNDALSEWVPCSVPLDGHDEPTKEMAEYINKKFTEEDLEKTLVDGNLVPVTKAILDSHKKRRLEALRGHKEQEITSLAKEKLVSGFYSEALGTLFEYSSSLENQQNLTNSLLSGKDCYIKCGNLDGWVRRLHTNDEAKQVLEDFNAYKDSLLDKLDTLKLKLAKSFNEVSIGDISW